MKDLKKEFCTIWQKLLISTCKMRELHTSSLEYIPKEFISIQKLAIKKALGDGMKKGLKQGKHEI